jgi:hypothetical protein
MLDTRRKFLMTLAASAASLVMMAQSTLGQMPASTKSQQKTEPKSPESPELTPPTKAMLEANDKDIKKKVEKLFQLASELKDEVEKTDSSQVLSLALIKKAEEIEKLAKDIKSRSKG